jgi:hypothetical protein
MCFVWPRDCAVVARLDPSCDRDRCALHRCSQRVETYPGNAAMIDTMKASVENEGNVA